MHISFVNNHDGSNDSNVPLHAKLVKSEVRGNSPTTSSAHNNILLHHSESVKNMCSLKNGVWLLKFVGRPTQIEKKKRKKKWSKKKRPKMKNKPVK